MTAKLWDENNAEAEIVVPISGRGDAAISNAAAERNDAPSTAPKYLGAPYRWGGWSSGVCLGGVTIIAIFVAAPLPYIAAQVMYAQFVAAFFSYGVRTAVAIAIPCHVT